MTSRRRFLRSGLALSASAFLPLACFYDDQHSASSRLVEGFGSLNPKLPENASTLTQTAAGDLSQEALLELAPGFRYWAYSLNGERMNDGTLVPGNHDGMAAFAGEDGDIIVVRNHELEPQETRYGNRAGVDITEALKYDAYATGGTTHMIFNQEGQLQRHFASMGGTIRNCAGGPTPWQSWLSCEEDVSLPDGDLQQRHGYVFEVPAAIDAPIRAKPLKAMGRFNHEACAVDPQSGFVYLTEDRDDSCLYRFCPDRYGDLSSGQLQVLAIKNHARLHTGTQQFERQGKAYEIEWLNINDTDPDDDTLRYQAQDLGAAIFVRGEGAWATDQRIYFSCTSGGDAERGQIWFIEPANNTLSLFIESSNQQELDHPDNITICPNGRLYLCEDGSGEQFVLGFNPQGQLYRIARNNWDNAEFTGICFSPNGRFMFVNSQDLGVTYVIEGPWGAV